MIIIHRYFPYNLSINPLFALFERICGERFYDLIHSVVVIY